MARQVLALQAAAVAVLIAVGATLVYMEARRGAEATATAEVRDLALSLAALPEVGAALESDDPGPTLRAIADPVDEATNADFVVFMDTDRTRYTHPDPEQIGRHYIGTIAPALEGRVHTETYTGTLGPSVRAVAPILDSDGRVAALVSVGILQENVGGELRRRLPQLLGLALLVLLVSMAGTWAIGRRLHRQTLGLGPAEITRMYQLHDATLHSVRSGLVVVDGGRIVIANDEALRLLGLPEDYADRAVEELGLTGSVAELLASGRRADDELHVHGDLVLVANQRPATARTYGSASVAVGDGRALGTLATFRDHTELQALSGELDSVRGFAEALRAQAHESSNRLHSMVTMIELGHAEEAVEFATTELATTQQLVDGIVSRVSEPALAALLLGKAYQAGEKGIEFAVDGSSADGGGIEPRT
ncbi:sensor histidine kinase [Glycomyces albus]